MARKKKGTHNNSNITQEFIDRLPIIKFIGGFFVFTIVFYLISDAEWFDVIRKPLLVLYTQLSSIILNVFGLNTYSSGSILSNPSFSVDVQEGCDAVVPTILYTTAVLVFPTSWNRKIRGLGIGIPSLFVLNLIRIISLFLTGIYVPNLFDFMHVEFWQALFILATVLIFISWLRKLNTT